jgi:hypothetical protein
MKAQTRKGAVIESSVNLVVGFSAAWAINYLALSVLKYPPTAGVLVGVGGAVTIASVARAFFFRRLFEWLRIRKAPPAFLYIAEELAAERTRQITGEGYGLAHDDQHTDGELAAAAAAYCLAAVDLDGAIMAADPSAAAVRGTSVAAIRGAWPFDLDALKPESRRRCLVKAGALAIAEIGRLDRAAEMRGVL